MPIRPFNPQTDMEPVVALYCACFAEAPWFERFDPRELEAEFHDMLTWPDTRVLMTGEIPDYARRDLAHEDKMYRGYMR